MPGKQYFGDLLDDSDSKFGPFHLFTGKLKYEVEKPFRIEDVKLLAFKLKHSHPNGFVRISLILIII